MALVYKALCHTDVLIRNQILFLEKKFQFSATASLLATWGELGDSIRRVEIVKVGVAETSSGHTTNGVVVGDSDFGRGDEDDADLVNELGTWRSEGLCHCIIVSLTWDVKGRFCLCFAKCFFVVCNRCFNEIKTGYPAKAATDLFLAMKKFPIGWF